MPNRDLGKQRAYARKYYRKHKEVVRKKHREYYQKNREKLLSKSNKYRKNNREQRLEYGVKYRDRIKTEILTHYGNGKLACVTCGETRKECLSIDHINDGGTQHRKLTGYAGNPFYCWLRKNHFPTGYQTLCMNCQFVKRFS